MPEVQEVFRMATQKVHPDAGFVDRQYDHRRKHERRRKVGTFAVATAIGVAALASILATQVARNATTPADQTSTAAPRPGPVPFYRQNASVVDLEGNVLRVIPGLPDDAYALSLSQDRTRIAFVTGTRAVTNADHATTAQNTQRIATIRIDGSGLQRLGPGGIYARSPAWSPDGTMIAFAGQPAAGPGPEFEIFVMDADGSDVRKLTSGPGSAQDPQWSPDGSTIVYSRFTDTGAIWTIPVGGGPPSFVTTTPAGGTPAYSPDGFEIAYSHGGEIWLVGSDGADPHPIVGGEDGGSVPRWSPDGTMLAYTTSGSGDEGYVDVGGNVYTTPLLQVNVIDLATGEHHAVGQVAMALSNAPVWWSNDQLLIRRVVRP